MQYSSKVWSVRSGTLKSDDWKHGMKCHPGTGFCLAGKLNNHLSNEKLNVFGTHAIMLPLTNLNEKAVLYGIAGIFSKAVVSSLVSGLPRCESRQSFT